MKIFTRVFVFFLIPMLTSCVNSRLTKLNGTDNFISYKNIKKHIEFLSSDSLKGRNTPSPELDSAAEYIAEKFSEYGLQKLNGSFFQKVKLGKIKLGNENSLIITANDQKHDYKIKQDFTPFEMTGNKHVVSSVMFAGYGIDAPEFGYNDYINTNVKGKIVFILKHEPGENVDSSLFEGNNPTKYSSIELKVKTAIKHGATGILIAQDPLNHNLLTPSGYPWPSLSQIIPDDALPLSMIADESKKVPVMQVGREVINQLFGSVEKLKSIQLGIDKNFAPNSFELQGIKIELRTETNITETDAYNVAGIIEGSDSAMKKELLVIGAHYDHIGYNKAFKPGEDFIYNGADDNASGTAVMLGVAEALKKSDIKPKRSILFIAFCGEEKGLFGSRYYSSNPLFSLENTVAMLNLDMVGRNNIDSLSVFGGLKNPALISEIKKANESVGFKLDIENKIQNGDSDHSSFQALGIPSVCFHSGIHADLHKVSDDASKINFDKVTKVSKLIFLTASIITGSHQIFNK